MRNCGSVRHGSVDKQSRHHHRDTVAQPVVSRGRCLPPAARTFIFFGTSEKLAGHCSEGSEGHGDLRWIEWIGTLQSSWRHAAQCVFDVGWTQVSVPCQQIGWEERHVLCRRVGHETLPQIGILCSTRDYMQSCVRRGCWKLTERPLCSLAILSSCFHFCLSPKSA